MLLDKRCSQAVVRLVGSRIELTSCGAIRLILIPEHRTSILADPVLVC
jgi:hypothetical protein